MWVFADWIVQGRHMPCNIIELGPGKGTLIKNMLNVFSELNQFETGGLHVHLVEASPQMTALQYNLLTGNSLSCSSAKQVSLENGIKVTWYTHLSQVPKGLSYYIAHEFLDALPVHQFKLTNTGWREVMIDIDNSYLKFVLSRSPTPASVAYTKLLPENITECEVCPEALVLVEEMAQRLIHYGGTALLADYGHKDIKYFTLRGFKDHKECHILSQPGKMDITADVNFKMIEDVVHSQGCSSHGPITQNEFLHKMGIRQRIEVLLKSASPEQAKGLVASYELLTSPEQMGERFKFLAITKSNNHIPTPFY